MDNAKMRGENITYIPVSRSLPIRMDQHEENYEIKCLQIHVYKACHGKEMHDMAWHGKARHDMEWNGMERKCK
jgi:hypothetical protein